MFLFGMVFLTVALVLIGIGVAVGLVACAASGALLSLGVLSSSVFTGVRSGRPSVGIRAFLLQCGVLAGAPAGAVCAWLARSLFESDSSGWPVLLYGAIGAAAGGVVVALLLDYRSRQLYDWASAKLPRARPLSRKFAKSGRLME